MTDLETEIENLKKQLRDLAERVRVDAVATEFLEQKVELRVGDSFVYNGTIYHLGHIYSSGKWCVSSDGRSFEPHAPGVEHFPNAERLYTRAEVAEIVAKATKENEIAALVEHNLKMDRALKDISNSTNPEYTIRRAREALGL